MKHETGRAVMHEGIAQILKRGGIGVLPTDTIYGVVASALHPRAVRRLYRLRKRNLKKPMIILIGGMAALRSFGVLPSAKERAVLRRLWPGPASVILPCGSKKFAYLHRGTNSLAFRLPKNEGLLALLRQAGPLIAPSANIEGKPYAKTVREARKYFGEKVDFYIDAGRIAGKPSRVFKIEHGRAVQVR